MRRLFSAEFAIQLALKILLSHFLEAEGGVHLSQHVIGRHTVVLEVVDMGTNFGVNEAANETNDRLVFFGPFIHWRKPPN